MKPRTLIGVIGGGSCDAETAARAREVGRLIAENGCDVVCGGLGGVMEAVCEGAAGAGGLTIGVLPGDTPDTANPHVQIRIATGIGIARNVIIVRSAAAVIAIDGGPGTLSEIAYCLQLGVPVIGLGTWDVAEEITRAATPEEAVAEALKRV